jgi:cytochrome c
MDNRFNTIAGWVLAGGIVLLGTTLVTGEYFKAERPEKMGYPIAGVVEEGAGGGAAAEPSVEETLQHADLAAGEASFRKCTACHNITQGGPNQLGPNLWGVVGTQIGHHRSDFAYSDAIATHGGSWSFDNLYQWLKSPRTFAPGTKMTFAGLSDPQERANVIAFLNAHGSNLPLPPPPAAANAAGAAPDTNANTVAPASGNQTTPAATPQDSPGHVGGPAANQAAPAPAGGH